MNTYRGSVLRVLRNHSCDSTLSVLCRADDQRRELSLSEEVLTIKCELDLVPVRSHKALWLRDWNGHLHMQQCLRQMQQLADNVTCTATQHAGVGAETLTTLSWPNLGQCLPSRSCQWVLDCISNRASRKPAQLSSRIAALFSLSLTRHMHLLPVEPVAYPAKLRSPS